MSFQVRKNRDIMKSAGRGVKFDKGKLMEAVIRVAENSLLPWTARKNATPSFDILFNLDALIWNPCLAYAAKMQSSFSLHANFSKIGVVMISLHK